MAVISIGHHWSALWHQIALKGIGWHKTALNGIEKYWMGFDIRQHWKALDDIGGYFVALNGTGWH
jgi:hypothetical protein